jgi:hypothetical protein
MTRTMWIGLFCLLISASSIAIRAAMPQASLFAEAVPDQSQIAMAPVPNEGAKSDRLELPVIRAATAISQAAQPAPVEAPSTKTETNKTETNKAETNRIPHRRCVGAASSTCHKQWTKEEYGQ